MTKKMILAIAFGQLLYGALADNYTTPEYVPPKEHHPWDEIQLTKAERRGKTYDELQGLRKQKLEVKE